MKASLLMMVMVSLLSGCTADNSKPRVIEVSDLSIRLDGVPVNVSGLRDALNEDRISRRGGDCLVITLISPDCHFSQLRRVCDAMKDARIWKVDFALASSTNQQIQVWPDPICGCHVPWHVISAYVSGKQISSTTNSDKGATDAMCVRVNATPDTTAQELFVFLRQWADHDAVINIDETVGSNTAARATSNTSALL